MGALIVGLLWFGSDRRSLPAWLGGEPEVVVRIMRVRQQVEPVIVRAVGDLLPANEFDVTSKLSGKVTEVRFKVGDRVSANAHVATIRSDALTQRGAEIEAAIRAARDNSKMKEEQLRVTEQQLTRARELHNKDLIPRRDVEHAGAANERARADADLARAQLAQQEAMQTELSALQRFTRVTTPTGGVVTHRWVEPGAAIAPSSPILTIGSADTLRLAVRIAAHYAADIRPGMDVEIVDSTVRDKKTKGTVLRVEPPAKDDSRSVDVDIGVDVTGGQPGLGGKAEATIRIVRPPADIRLPQAVILSEGDKNYVYKLADDRAWRQRVALGAQYDGVVEITQGLRDGDSVIVDQLDLLKPGLRVRVFNAN
jgi:membrane fusion protein (multidrug efflux system)